MGAECPFWRGAARDPATDRRPHLRRDRRRLGLHCLLRPGPVTRQSGTTLASESRNRRGNHPLKNAMFLAAFASLRDPVSRTFYDRKKAEGKRYNAALICRRPPLRCHRGHPRSRPALPASLTRRSVRRCRLSPRRPGPGSGLAPGQLPASERQAPAESGLHTNSSAMFHRHQASPQLPEAEEIRVRWQPVASFTPSPSELRAGSG